MRINEQQMSDINQICYVAGINGRLSMNERISFRAFMYRAARRGADMNECTVGEWRERWQEARRSYAAAIAA